MLNLLLKNNLPVVSLSEIPRSLEDVYLQAIAAPDGVPLEASAELDVPHGS